MLVLSFPHIVFEFCIISSGSLYHSMCDDESVVKKTGNCTGYDTLENKNEIMCTATACFLINLDRQAVCSPSAIGCYKMYGTTIHNVRFWSVC